MDKSPEARKAIFQSDKELFASIRANNRRWESCPRHYFPHQPDGYKFGEKVTCDHCGYSDRMMNVGLYIRGYVAAGGNPADVMPDWKL